ncbi:very short patch repair endonuclease [Microvirga mediterraneensis]|uniref:DNA mismatch endonuclease Vsr n=1 Tax=Microvirga mediterraneensis TaxID=2754695 RepID=A0A838BUU4_9HYPH|nr:very short patch repair endonuclease [Microvirga mediterraneensis]MBA1158673.1 DNA mismatch endonuclease Vsr [Microvirga mediterraneensis]
MGTRPRVVTDAQTSARMKRIRQRDTKPELMLRRWLWARGIRFTTSNRDLPGSPDLANRKHRWAIFVHGCFWHGHENCVRSRLPKRNEEFWRDKIDTNKERDRRKAAQLSEMGFYVMTIWGCEVDKLGELTPQQEAHLLDPLRRLNPPR